jgi:hypothetical protein
MKKLVEKFSKIAIMYANDHEEHWHPGPGWQEMFTDRLAELVVQECVNLIQTTITLDEGYPANRRSRQHIKEIRERFQMESDETVDIIIMEGILRDLDPNLTREEIDRIWLMCQGNPWNAEPLYNILKLMKDNDGI